MAIDLSALLEDDKPKKANSNLDKAVRLYQEGISVTTIINETHVSTATLYSEIKDRGISKRSKRGTQSHIKPEPDHNVDNRYVLQSHKPDQVPGFWKRLKYAFSANTNDLKD